MCLTILLLDVPIIRRIKDDKWYKYLLLMPPLLFIALIAAKAYDFVIPVGEYTWNVDLAFALVIVEAINLFYVKFVSKKEVHLSEWFILLAIIVLDFFIKIVWGIFTQNGFNYYNRPYRKLFPSLVLYKQSICIIYDDIPSIDKRLGKRYLGCKSNFDLIWIPGHICLSCNTNICKYFSYWTGIRYYNNINFCSDVPFSCAHGYIPCLWNKQMVLKRKGKTEECDGANGRILW